MGNEPRFTELKRLTAESGDPAMSAYALGFVWGFLDLAQQERTLAELREEKKRRDAGQNQGDKESGE